MAYKNRYFKNPVGVNSNYSFIGIGSQVEYTAIATYVLFATTSVDGEVGVFNKATGALISGAGPVSSTLPIFIAVNAGTDRDGNKIIKITDAFTVAASKVVKTAYLAPVKGVTTIIATGAVAATGDVLGIKVLDLTVGGNPINSINYEVTVKAGESFDTAMARLVTMINDTASVVNRYRDALVTAAYTAGTDTLVVTNVNFGSVMKVLPQEKLATATVGNPTITKTVLGSGFPEEVALFEEAMNIRNGVTTNYPSTPMANADSFGKPKSLIVSTGTYNHYTFTLFKDDIAKTPAKIQHWPDTMEVIVPTNGAANPDAELALIFGV